MLTASRSPGRKQPPDPHLSALSPPRQRLVRIAQHLGFGTIHQLSIRGGDPVVDPLPRIVRRKKNGSADLPRLRNEAADFALKREWVAFFVDLDAIGDGTILVIEVAHGLPIIHEYEDVIDV